jgi:hypothetical protein
MGGIADQNDPATVPFLDREPINGAAMNLIVVFQRGEVLANDSPKIIKTLTQAVKPASRRLMLARSGRVAKAIRAAVAYRAKPKETILAQQK